MKTYTRKSPGGHRSEQVFKIHGGKSNDRHQFRQRDAFFRRLLQSGLGFAHLPSRLSATTRLAGMSCIFVILKVMKTSTREICSLPMKKTRNTRSATRRPKTSPVVIIVNLIESNCLRRARDVAESPMIASPNTQPGMTHSHFSANMSEACYSDTLSKCEIP